MDLLTIAGLWFGRFENNRLAKGGSLAERIAMEVPNEELLRLLWYNLTSSIVGV